LFLNFVPYQIVQSVLFCYRPPFASVRLVFSVGQPDFSKQRAKLCPSTQKPLNTMITLIKINSPLCEYLGSGACSVLELTFFAGLLPKFVTGPPLNSSLKRIRYKR